MDFTLILIFLGSYFCTSVVNHEEIVGVVYSIVTAS